MEQMETMASPALNPAFQPVEADPEPLLLGEAIKHLLPSNLPWFGLALAATATAIPFWLGPRALAPFFLGILLVSAALVCAYLTWYGCFCARNRRFETLCANCGSRMWQLSCRHCGFPVPPLTLWLRGLFMPFCPHPNCGKPLSSRGGTLQTFCGKCGATRPQPHVIYGKPTRVIVWVDDTCPGVTGVQPEWEIIQNSSQGTLRLYNPQAGGMVCLLYVLNDYRDSSTPPVPPHLVHRTRLLLVSSTVPELWASQIRGHFGKNTLKETVPPLHPRQEDAHRYEEAR
jgi:hypothetical protein